MKKRSRLITILGVFAFYTEGVSILKSKFFKEKR